MKEVCFREDISVSKKYKEAYVKEIKEIIEQREKDAVHARNQYCKDIFKNPEFFRNDLKAMFGWPLTERKEKNIPVIKAEKLTKDADGSIIRISVEVTEGLFITGLLFKKDEEKRPLVIAQHGALGTPELVGNLYGDTANYNHMIERMLSFDVNVFSPQLLLWNSSYEVETERVDLDAKLKRVGSSITALEVYGIMRILDYLETQPFVGNIGMIGLSYGGFYTLFTAALDTRIKSAVSCSFFNTIKNHARVDWTWFQSAYMFADAEVACLIYPRKLCLEVGIQDETFDIVGARAEISRLRELSNGLKDKWLNVVEFNGTHEFCLDDEPLRRLAEDLKE